jgi:hypothetical protein
MKKYLMVMALLTSFNAYSDPNLFSHNLEGTYDCHSTNLNSNNLSYGKMKITKTDQTYSIETFHDDGSHYLGTGIYNQNIHTLAVAFRNTQNPLMVSFGVAEVDEKGSMSTSWAFLYDTTIGSSSCTKINLN